MTKINELLTGKGFIMVNKDLAKLVGLVPATIYGELLSTHTYWKERGQLTIIDGKDWFFCTIEDLEDKTTIKKDVQSTAINKLIREGLIVTKRHGLPAKRYFHITDKYNSILFDDYISEKTKSDDINVYEVEKDNKDRYNQISEIPNTTIRDSRKLDFGNSDTNNKHINNKDLNKKQININKLSIDNYQATEDENVINSVFKESEQPMIDVSQIEQMVIEQIKANEVITDEREALQLLTDAANGFYTEFAIGRWNKKEWTNLITQFVAETIAKKRHLSLTYGKLKGYVYVALKNITGHHDYKNSEQFNGYKESLENSVGIEIQSSAALPNGMYNWLDERE